MLIAEGEDVAILARMKVLNIVMRAGKKGLLNKLGILPTYVNLIAHNRARPRSVPNGDG